MHALCAAIGYGCVTVGGVGLSLDSAIDLFLDHVKVERGLARNSVEAYGRDLAKFRALRAEARASTTPTPSSRGTCSRYLVALSRGEAGGALAGAQPGRAARSSFEHLRAERHIARDPTADLELPRSGGHFPSR